MKALLYSCAAAWILAWIAIGCAIEYPVAVFSYAKHPDLPRTEFLKGHLGVIEPTYARSYLVVAYRYLTGVGLNPAERDQVRLYYNDRESGSWERAEFDWFKEWLRTRQRIPGTGPAPGVPTRAEHKDRYKYESAINSWQLNCADDAFRTAIVTLNDRAGRFGGTNPFVKNWLAEQDRVFSNCFSEKQNLPGDAPPNAPAWLKADRTYQTAAAKLYTNQFRDAEALFRQIAADPVSPWRSIAPYLAARALARTAESGERGFPRSAEGEEAFKKAEIQIDAILADRKLYPLHGMSRALRRRIRGRVHPEVDVRELARIVTQPGIQGSLRQDLWDYVFRLDYFLDPVGYVDPNAPKEPKPALPRQDEVTDWIVTFQSKESKDTTHAVTLWKRSKALPWLVAAIAKASPAEPAARDLVQASSTIAADSPAYWMLAYHRNRLRIELGDKSSARDELRTLLANPPVDLPKSALNRLQSLRMFTAPDLAGFLAFAQRIPVLVTTTGDAEERPNFYGTYMPRSTPDDKLLRWDSDSIKVMNERAPLAMWLRAAQSPDLPAHLRQEFVLATLARATLLQSDAALQEIATAVAAVYPGGKSFADDIIAAATPEARHFAAVYFLLHFANVRPYLTSGVSWHVPHSPTMDSYVNNWWCALDSDDELDWNSNNHFYYSHGPRSDPDRAARRAAFLTEADIVTGKAEFEKMAATGTAPDYLPRQAIAWARKHPSDPRNAEALAHAVRVTRYGCSDTDTAATSIAAHRLLHSAYPKSPWAKRTPYAFSGGHQPR